MFIDDYIEKIALQEELENVKEQLKAVQDENAKLKTTIDRHCKAGIERIDILNNKNETIATLTAEVHKLKGELNILKYSNSVKEGKIGLVAMATDEAQKKGAHAGNLIKSIASIVGGGGGGRPNMAQAGGKNPAGVDDALKEAVNALGAQIK